jgi:hypothetical protein
MGKGVWKFAAHLENGQSGLKMDSNEMRFAVSKCASGHISSGYQLIDCGWANRPSALGIQKKRGPDEKDCCL